MKKQILYLVVFLTVSCNMNERYENESDLYKVKIGMHYNEVNEVMRNTPFRYRFTEANDIFFASYISPMAYSDYFKIEYRAKDSIVVDIWYGD